MATNVSKNSKFSNAIVGTPMVGADVDIYEEHTTPRYQVGTGFKRSDGAEFRYSHFGTVVSRAGLLCAQDFSESGTAQIDSKITTPANSTMVPGYNIKPNEIGSQHIQYTHGSRASQYAGGYILIGNGTGSGFTYRIRESNITNLAGSTTLTLYSKLQAALDGTSDFALYGCKWANLESHPATAGTDIAPVGVNTAAHITADRYGWVQTKGVVGIFRDASSMAVGDVARVSQEDPGAVSEMDKSQGISANCMPAVVLDAPIIGYVVDAAANNEFALCNINL